MACGAVYSSAVLPFQAGDVRVMQKSARLFLHNISISIGEANLNTVHSVANETTRVHNAYCDLVSERSSLTPAKIAKLMEEESYLSADECLDLGLCDLVLDYNTEKIQEKKAIAKKKKKK